MNGSAGRAAFAFALSLAAGWPCAAAPLANVPVNDLALDTTTQDTQSNAVVVEKQGSECTLRDSFDDVG